MKRTGFIVSAVASLALAQTPSKQFEGPKQSPLEGKTFSAKTVETKGFATKPFATKAAPTKEMPVQTNAFEGRGYATKSLEQPAGKSQSWWQKLFPFKTARANAKSFATTNVPTRVNARLQEKLDHMEQPKSLPLPTLKPTPEEINRPR